jgi:hypothetical protein
MQDLTDLKRSNTNPSQSIQHLFPPQTAKFKSHHQSSCTVSGAEQESHNSKRFGAPTVGQIDAIELSQQEKNSHLNYNESIGSS